jgi:hypothetical protein
MISRQERLSSGLRRSIVQQCSASTTREALKAQRRSEELRAGTVASVPAATALANARRRLLG